MTYEIVDGSAVVTGTVMTDELGEFIIHVQTTMLTLTEQTITVSVAKTTGKIQHRFSCNGVPCKSKYAVLVQN